MNSSKSLSIAVMFLLYGKAAALPITNNLAKVQDSNFLDTDVGQKMS
jgi:hypothetical protein